MNAQLLETTIQKIEKTVEVIPESWKRAVGILKNNKIDPLKYQKDIRKEWGSRAKKLEKQYGS